MRNRVFLNSPRIQLSSVLGVMAAISVSLAGCGGGGGSSSSNNSGSGGKTPPENTTLATITGTVKDTSPSHNPVVGASVTIVVPNGINVITTTNSKGVFVATNVALTATTFKVSSPDPVAYYNYANYDGSLYDLQACTLPLPKLLAGANAPYTEVDMYLGGSNPPPPPPVGGCPG